MVDTNANYISLMMGRYGKRTDASLRVNTVLELNVAKRLLEAGKSLPRFLQSNIEQVQTATNDANVPLPVGFIREIDEALVRSIDTSVLPVNLSVRMRKKTRVDIERLLMNAATGGQPNRYCVRSTNMRVFPYADKIYNILIPCYLKTPDLADDTNLDPWFANAPDWLMGVAGARVARFHLQDVSLAKDFVSLGAVGEGLYMANDTAVEETNMDYSSSELLADVETD